MLRRFRLFIRSGAYGTMRPWRTLANHAYTIRRMEPCQEDVPTRTRVTIRLTPVFSVLRRQLTGSGRHLTCLVSVALRSTQRSNEVTSNALSSARRRCFTLPTLPRFLHGSDALAKRMRNASVAGPRHRKIRSKAKAAISLDTISAIRAWSRCCQLTDYWPASSLRLTLKCLQKLIHFRPTGRVCAEP